MPPPVSLPGLPDDFQSTLFHGDVVTKTTDPTYRGKVMRGWADEDIPIDPHHPLELQHNHPLVRGQVLLAHMHTGQCEVVSELDLQLFERSFLKGDLVKETLTSLESAVVVDIKTECILEHAMSGERLPRSVPWSKLRNAVKIEAKDRVVYDQWIGTVEEVFEEGLIEAIDGTPYRIAEMGGLLETGRLAKEALPDQVEFLAEYSEFPSTANTDVDRIVRVTPLILFIVWNAINQTLPVSEHDKHPEPKRFWCGMEIEQLTHFECMKHQAPPLGTTVEFRSPEDELEHGAKPTYHIRGTIPVRVYRVVENRTKLTLRWQDGTETEEYSAGFVPYRNVDDYESWPGEHLVWRTDNGERHPAVVQSYNARQRIAEVLLLDTHQKETVSVLELDTGGFGKANYGVGLGQTVLFCEDNGAPSPEVPSLGQVEPREDGHEGFRNELQRLGLDSGILPEFGTSLPKGDTSAVNWWGEVVDLHLDGKVVVELYSGERRTVDIKNIVVLNDPEVGFLPEEFDDGASFKSDTSWETMSVDGEMGAYEDETDEVGTEDKDGWGGSGANGDDITMDDDSMNNEDATHAPANGFTTDDEDARDAEAVAKIVEDEPVARQWSTAATSHGPSHSAPGSANLAPLSMPIPSRPSLDDDEKWRRFDIIEEAPADHHYFVEPLLPPSSRTYHSRLAKEHRALASSLPENILVRTYEDRTDLMRVLIVGPEGTPYADAPFIFDVYLNPTKFPFEPPQVYFHSHTNGLGRCNPNLYEEGKVCLSILGTWAGDKSESWSPNKSSLLQVFVSISGLVLVRSPYHCEPAFAKLEGTREGRVNSRLYSEKAYVLSRAFVRTALDHPPTGFQGEIHHYYIEMGRLNNVIDHAKRLIAKGEADAAAGEDAESHDSEMAEMWNADAMGTLTMGAIITLKRTIVALEKMRTKFGAETVASA